MNSPNEYNDAFASISDDDMKYGFNDNLIILKKVKSIRQLRNSEKDRVRLCYKEAILRGFTVVNDIQCYIASKSKIWIDRIGIEYLKKSEEIEDKKWYYSLAKNHFAYVGAYRKAVDEIEQLQKELWSMMMDPLTTNLEKVHIIKELHSLTKTYTLLLRDLPFISNLTKYYDLHDMENHRHKSSPYVSRESDNIVSCGNSECNNAIQNKLSDEPKYSVNDLKKLKDESGLYLEEEKSITDAIRPINSNKKKTDIVMDEMKSQIEGGKEFLDKLLNSKDYHESINRVKEIKED